MTIISKLKFVVQMSGWAGAQNLHAESGKAIMYSGMTDCFRRTVQEEGVRALFKVSPPQPQPYLHPLSTETLKDTELSLFSEERAVSESEAGVRPFYWGRCLKSACLPMYASGSCSKTKVCISFNTQGQHAECCSYLLQQIW